MRFLQQPETDLIIFSSQLSPRFANNVVFILTVLPKPKIPIGFWLAYPLNIKMVSSLIGDNRHDIVRHDSAMRT